MNRRESHQYENDNPDAARRNGYQAVIGRPSTRIRGRPTGKQREIFSEEVRDTSIIFDRVSYTWADKYGFLTEAEGPARYLALKGKNHVSPERPQVPDRRIVDASLTDKQARAAQELNDTAKANCDVVEGFCQRFSKKFRKSIQ